jgi:peptidoglycan/xylan/chitin deacetylase (PgdA/CDA1 family)
MARLGSYGGEDSPGDISRVIFPIIYRSLRTESLWLKGMFAGEVGVPRLLKLFAKYGIKTTWFVPGK